MFGKKLKSYLVVFTLTLALWLCAVSPARALTVKDIRFGTHPDKIRMVIELSDKVEFKAFTLASPDRMVVDLPHFEWQATTISKPAASHITDIRQGALTPDTSRIVFDLAKPVTIRSAFVLPSDQGRPNRLVLDFAVAGPQDVETGNHQTYGRLDSAAAAGAAPAVNQNIQTIPALPAQTAAATTMTVPARKPSATAATPREKPLIIIDPGHGGVDPGAIGANGLFEKHVTLAVAKELKRQLEATGHYRVKLTRSTDVYLKLYKRVAIARQNNADLFVSLHADSVAKGDAQGASIYTLSEKASDAQTARLAEKENRVDLIAGVDLTVEDEVVANILVDLAMRDTMNQSKFLANTMVGKLHGGNIRTLDNPHRYAGFAVLKAPDIPSILVEMGFMSSRKEARMLSQPDYQRKIARALVSGIDAYFRKVRANQES